MPASAQVARLHPVDEAANQPDLFSFRAQLIQTVLRRDTAALFAVLVPDVMNSFGGDGGMAEFKDMWRPAASESELWRTLAEVLSLGGMFYGDTLFSAPYTYTRFPPELDAFDHVVVIGSNVRVRAEPDPEAEILATVSFDILAIGRDVSSSNGWDAVRLGDGRHGFIDSRYARSPGGYRLGFVRRGGHWLLGPVAETTA